MRPLVSYDDITLPYQPQSQSSRPPPSKKRKGSHQNTTNNRDSLPNTHHVDSSTDHNCNNSRPSAHAEMVNEDLKNEEHRELTHEEIWDDSALIDAWNAATEEYEAYNGPDKGWKTQPVHKSPLWYNVPSPKSGKVPLPEISSDAMFPNKNGVDDSDDSQPLNFETFVPTHDPSLELPFPMHPTSAPGPDFSPHHLSNPPGSMVSQDEAFTRALGAMYWGGYWTAVYHCQRYAQQMWPGSEDVQTGAEAEGDDDVEEEEEFVSTQR